MDLKSRPIILAHSFYKRAGGEEQVFRAEAALLEQQGHRVERFVTHNSDLDALSPAAGALQTVWNRSSARRLRDLVKDTRASLVHFHNTFPIMSPSVYYAARAEGAAIVQTLHNYRLLCVQGFFVRDGKICEKCLGKRVGYPGIFHACYRKSKAASAAAVGMFAAHWAFGTWQNLPDVFIGLSEFARSKFIEGGLPSDRIRVKPNLVFPDPGAGTGDGAFALFVGRLSPEKGISTLIETWERYCPKLPLWIVGEGPLTPVVTDAAERCSNIIALGPRPHNEVLALLGRATVCIVPSVGYETFGLVAVEALIRGTPVVASRLGPLPELVEHTRTGYLFDPGNPRDLAAQIATVAESASKMQDMRFTSRRLALLQFDPLVNYECLTAIYESALEKSTVPHSAF
jgi:glycosyltransferase involved in cell wall biosynthesis